MLNLVSLIGAVVGLISLFISAAAGVKLIAVFLLVGGLIQLLAPANAAAAPPAPRRAAARQAAPSAESDEIEEETDEAADEADYYEDESSPATPADAYRTFTPEEIAESRPAKAKRRPAADK